LSSLVRLYLRANAVNSYLTKNALESLVQKQLKKAGGKEDVGLKFLVALGMLDICYIGKTLDIETWINDID
jgi:hypothetical protein